VYYVTSDGGDGFAIFVPGDYGTLGNLIGRYTRDGYQVLQENPLHNQEQLFPFLDVVKRIICEINGSQQPG
jgi:hypothetical protein